MLGESRISMLVHAGLQRSVFIKSEDGSSVQRLGCANWDAEPEAEPEPESAEPPEAVPKLPPLLPSTSGIATLILGWRLVWC